MPRIRLPSLPRPPKPEKIGVSISLRPAPTLSFTATFRK